jgi:hypothetical protein
MSPTDTTNTHERQRLDACQLDLLAELDRTRANLDATTELLNRGLDLLEQLRWGVFDLDDAVAEVRAFCRDCAARKALRPIEGGTA